MRKMILFIAVLFIPSAILAQEDERSKAMPPSESRQEMPIRPGQLPVQNLKINLPQKTLQPQTQPKQTPAVSEPEKTPAPGKILIKFEEGDIKDLVKEFSEILGRNFTYDETLKGRIALIGPKEVSKWEAQKIFEASLEMIGYSVVWGWPINKIVPVSDAKAEGNVPVI